MDPEFVSWWIAAVLVVLAMVPAFTVWRRRQRSQDRSDLARRLGDHALEMRRAPDRADLDAVLLADVRSLDVPEVRCLELARELPKVDPLLLAEVLQRLALRLKRRVAFERMLLARTAPGRWRGATAAMAPVLLILVLVEAGLPPPLELLLMVAVFETLGCWLLWRVTRVVV